MDKKYYEQAAYEMQSGILDSALMAKAVALSEGDEKRSRARYLTLRAEELAAEARRRRAGETASHAADLAVSGVSVVGRVAAATASAAGPLIFKTAKYTILLFIVLLGIVFAVRFVEAESVFSAEQDKLLQKARGSGVWFPDRDYPVGSTVRLQNIQYDAMLAQLESKYSPANPTSANFSQDLIRVLEARVLELEGGGASPPEALKRAVGEETNAVLYIPPVR